MGQHKETFLLPIWIDITAEDPKAELLAINTVLHEFFEFSAIDINDTSYIKIKVDGKIMIFKARVTNFEARYHSDPFECFYADNRVERIVYNTEMDVVLEFSVVDDNGVLCKVVNDQTIS